MAEKSSVAFGRYLKMLRVRRGLSLDEIYARSQSFPEPLMKGYLSRVENGHQKLAFPKMIPLSRILEVPAEVLVERMELDLELDKLGGPDTVGLSYSELILSGNTAGQVGRIWDAYGLLRDAIQRARLDPVRPSFRDHEEQYSIAVMSCACAAGALGRGRIELHELEFVHRDGQLETQHGAFLYSKLAHCYGRLGLHDQATRSLDSAIELAKSSHHNGFLASAISSKAYHILVHVVDPVAAIVHYRQAYDLYQKLGSDLDMARTLNNIAQCYFDSRNFRAARRVLDASAKLVQSHETSRQGALNRILLGEIELAERNSEIARSLFKTASAEARTLNDKTLRFKAEYQLLRLAQQDHNTRSERVILKRLRRLSAWIPPHIPELQEFKQLSD